MSKIKDVKTSLEHETRLAKTFSYLMITCIVSGVLITLFKNEFQAWLQWNIIGHTVVASILTLPALVYTFVHFRRTVGIRKIGVLFSGLVSSALLLGVLISGIHIALVGQLENQRWVPQTHSALSYITILIVFAHIALHWFARPTKRQNSSQKFITFNGKQLLKNSGIAAASYLIAIGLIALLYTNTYDAPVNHISDDYQQTYGAHPFKPSLTETKDSALIHVDQIAKSEQCGACHTNIYQQWMSSTHRQAASDPTYVKNINLLVENKGIAAARYCEGCHAPVALLTGELTEGGTHGGMENTPAHLEGVGCMGCHGIEKVLNTSGTASYLFSPKEYYLFDSSTTLLAQKIRNFLIQSSPQKHKLAMGGHPISDPKLCATCHEQFMDKSMNDWGWVKMQSTYQEWLKSPFSGQQNQTNSETTQTRCQDCHFAKVIAADPSADHQGKITSHRSLGANTFLPILNGDDEQLELTKQFLQSSKLLVHIEKPNPKVTLSNKQTLENNLRSASEDELPYFLFLGDTGEISVTVTNRLVGHSFPAGTTDLNQAWLSISVNDANGQEVYASGKINENDELDKSAHIYRSTPVDRHGKAVWRHDLFRMTGESSKNVIQSGRSDIKTYGFKVPSWAKSPLTVEAVLKYRKLNQRYAEWALNSTNIELPIIELARDRITIPLVNKVSAKSALN